MNRPTNVEGDDNASDPHRRPGYWVAYKDEEEEVSNVPVIM